jgi:Abortive infection alpha
LLFSGGDWLKVRRAENLLGTLQKMQERLKKRGIKPEKVSLFRALPILIAAADESIDELQELWAKLLAAAADPQRAKSFRIAFINVAKLMDPLDAVILEKVGASNVLISGTVRNDLAAKLNLSRDQLDVSLAHLIELNLMWGTTIGPTPDATVAPLGREFLKAVGD